MSLITDLLLLPIMIAKKMTSGTANILFMKNNIPVKISEFVEDIKKTEEFIDEIELAIKEEEK
jgi:hypothetical protein